VDFGRISMIYNLRQFSRPDTLVNLDPQNLLTLLNKYRDYFETGISGIQIPEQIDKEFPFDKLASEFANPVFDGDTKMFEDLALIEQMSRDRYAPVILDFLQNVPYRMDFEEKYQSLNNSLLMFLHDPERLYRIREELKLEDPKSYFIARHMGKKSAFACDDSRIEDFRRKLDDLYAGKKFGRGVTITHHRIPDGDYFLVRKGMPHSYQPTIGKDLSTVGIYFREEVFDIIIFDSERNELKLAINGERKWMR